MAELRVPPRPLLSKIAARIFNPINAGFDWLYHSEYNPFYRSGTLAIGLLFVLLATGFYLLFFYSVSNPYPSIVGIQEQIWFGRWVRALHRYATDAVLIAVFFHVLQLLAQGKTWGPRTLAWVSGVLLLCALCISTWTGYVMVWDTHGQMVAVAGLELLSVFPFLGSGMSHAFSGQNSLPASFFFMNLFLHIAIPLGMVLGMWIHTARLARTVWFPVRSIFWATLGGLFLLSIFVPAVLPPQADLLSILGEVPSDWWYGFWIPLIEILSPELTVAGIVLFILGLATVPWWWRPGKSFQPPISQVDVDGCNGCTQCARDCPYEAITMVPHPNGKHLLAQISPVHCVSCGICASSCAEFAVGPPGRTANDQLELVSALAERQTASDEEQDVIVIGCKHNESIPEFLTDYTAGVEGVDYFDLNCCATLHTDSLDTFLSNYEKVLLVGCAARNCVNRDGLDLLKGRLYGKRVPFLSSAIDTSRIVVAPHSEHEKDEIVETIEALQESVSSNSTTKEAPMPFAKRAAWYAKRSVASVILLALLAVVNQAPMGTAAAGSRLRVVGRLPGQVELNCRPLNEKELQTLPRHMQRKEICERQAVSYNLKVLIDGTEVLSKILKPRSIRGELPILLFEEVDVSPQEHQVRVTAEMLETPTEKQEQQDLEKTIVFAEGRISLFPIGEN